MQLRDRADGAERTDRADRPTGPNGPMPSGNRSKPSGVTVCGRLYGGNSGMSDTTALGGLA